MPPFSLNGDRFDMSTWWGRSKHFFVATDPRLMLASQVHIDAAKRKLAEYAANPKTLSPEENEAMWHARTVKVACVHPITGDTIFPLFRFAAFAPVNFFIVPFMLLPGTIASVPRTIAIHWFNQSYNVAVNYSNRSSSGVEMSVLFRSYIAATVVSVGLALGATFVMRRLRQPTGMTATLVRATLPFTAVSLAACANLMLSRSGELFKGTMVRDTKGNELGLSRTAGYYSLGMCCVTRFIWNVPCMVLPPFMVAAILRRAPHLSTGRPRIVVETLAAVSMVATGVPPALGAFTPTVTMEAAKLEPVFAGKVGPRATVTFYKGL